MLLGASCERLSSLFIVVSIQRGGPWYCAVKVPQISASGITPSKPRVQRAFTGRQTGIKRKKKRIKNY